MLRFYASPTGTGDGLTLETPGSLATVRGLAQTNAGTANILCHLIGGRYDLSVTGFALTAADSNSGGFITRWCKVPGDTVPIRFSGGIQITGWTLHDAGLNIWTASVPTNFITRQLYVNDSKVPRARYETSIGGFGAITTPSLKYTDASFPALAVPADVEAVYNDHGLGWTQWRLLVASAVKDGDTTTFTMNGYSGEIFDMSDSSWPATASFFENAYEFLTLPGFWYLNSVTDMLYYIPKSGEDMTTAEVFAPKSIEILTLNAADNVEITDVILEHAAFTTPTTQGGFLQTWGCKYLIASVETQAPFAASLTSCENIKVERCTIRHMGANAVYAGWGTRYNVFQGNLWKDIAGNGLWFGDQGAWPSNAYGEFVSSGLGYDTFVVSETLQNWDNTVRSNLFIGTNSDLAGGSATLMGHNGRTKYIHQEVSGWGYSGVYWDLKTADAVTYQTGNEIAYNKIHGVSHTLDDSGALHTNAVNRGLVVHDNYTYDITAPPDDPNFYRGSTHWGLAHHIYLETDCYDEDYYNNISVVGVGQDPGRWMLVREPNKYPLPDPVSPVIRAFDNYAEAGLGYYESINPSPPPPQEPVTLSVTMPTELTSSTPSTWPVAAQSIAANAGLEPLLLGTVLDDEVIAYGWKEIADPIPALSVNNGATVGTVEETMDGRMWQCVVTLSASDTGAVIAYPTEGINLTANITGTLSGVTTFTIDDIIPVTTCDRDSGNYSSGTIITLTPSVAPFQPVTTYYRINAGSWVEYTAPVAITAAMTFDFYSVDAELNAEATQARSYTVSVSGIKMVNGTAGGTVKKISGVAGGVIKKLVGSIWQ